MPMPRYLNRNIRTSVTFFILISFFYMQYYNANDANGAITVQAVIIFGATVGFVIGVLSEAGWFDELLQSDPRAYVKEILSSWKF